jgi:hypothetical protein
MTQIDMCPKTLRGTNLRYTLTRLLQLCGPSTVDELIVALRQWGFTVDGRPSKTVSDALRDIQVSSDSGVVRTELMPQPGIEHNGEPVALAPLSGAVDAHI